MWPQVLELPQLAQNDGVAEVDVRRGRVDPELHPQRAALAELALAAPPRGGRRRRCGAGNRRRRCPGVRHGANARSALHGRTSRVAAASSSGRRPTALACAAAAHAHAEDRSSRHASPQTAHAARRPVRRRRLSDPIGGDGAAGRPSGRSSRSCALAAASSPASAFLAFISTVFGMMMAVARDLPGSRTRPSSRAPRTRSCSPTTARADQLAKLTGNENRILVDEDEISPNIKNAVIAIEDRRFYEHRGVDYQRHRRALCQDVAQRQRRAGRLDDHAAVREERARGPGRPLGVPEAARGGAGLPPRAQVVEAEDPHPVPEHRLLRQRRLRDRVGGAHLLRRGDGDLRRGGELITTTRSPASRSIATSRRRTATPAQAAFLAGIIASPSAYDPSRTSQAPKARQDLVLDRMLDAGDDHPGAVRRGRSGRRSCLARTTSTRRSPTPRSPTSRPGSPSSSSTVTAPAASSAAA